MNDKLNLNRKYLYLAIGILCIVLLIFFITIRTQKSGHDDSTASTNNPTNEEIQEILDLTDEETKDPFTKNNTIGFDRQVINYLSSGSYTELERYLSTLNDSYRDGTEEESGIAVSYSSIINMYRSDLVSIQSLTSSSEPDFVLSNFFCADTLASAIIYATCSMKLDAFINQDSVLIPEVKSVYAASTNLEEIELDATAKAALTKTIQEKMPENTIMGVAQYDFTAYGFRLRFTAVCLENYLWAPYLINSSDSSEVSGLLSVAEAKDIRAAYEASNTYFDIDAFYIVS